MHGVNGHVTSLGGPGFQETVMGGHGQNGWGLQMLQMSLFRISWFGQSQR
jgi:hypothetical protein